jgi:catechol 2,3-dioxygenase-like lactoylglutathione lyase family enzyme
MPRLDRFLETSLYVDDPKRSAEFYRRAFGFAVTFEDDRLTAMTMLDQHILLLFKKGKSSGVNVIPGGIIPPHDADGRIHLAWGIADDELSAWRDWLTEQNIVIESETLAQRGGHCLYFRDPDGHLLELATRGTWDIF